MGYVRTIAIAVLLIALSGCGSAAFQANFIPNNPTSTARGFITSIQLSSVVGGNTFITVTVVTFEQFGSFSTFNFCGDFRNQFSQGAFTVVQFTGGQACATPITITVG